MYTPNAGRALMNLHHAGLSRRMFLQGMLAAAGAAGIGGALSGCALGGHDGPDGYPLLFLTADEAHILTALGEAIVPTQPGFPTIGRAGVIRRIDQELTLVDAAIQSDFRAAIDVLQFSPFVYGRFSRFTKLPSDGRREVVKSLMTSRVEILRAVGANLKLIVHFYYFAHPETWAAIGYDGSFGRLPRKSSEQDLWYRGMAGLPAAGEEQA